MKPSQIHKLVKGLYNEAQGASPSEYNDGFVSALSLVLEEMENLAWEEGDTFEDS